jgi:hypothetical protein
MKEEPLITDLVGRGIAGGRRLAPVRLVVACAALLVAVSSSAAIAQSLQPTGLAPAQNARMLVLPDGSLLVAEPGDEPNRATLSIFDANGDRRTFLGGLPSGLSSLRSPDGTTLLIPDGPDGLALVGNSLYIAIGEGDGFRPRVDRPGAIAPNPDGVSSPILASVLRIDFSSPDALNGNVPFFLEPASHESLLDGATVNLLGGELSASATLVAALRPGIPDAGMVYRASHPNGVAVLDTFTAGLGDRSLMIARRPQRSLFVADSGTNRLIRVDLTSGRSTTLVRFPDPQESATGPATGGTLQSVHSFNFGRLLVAISGASPGQGSVQAVNGATGATQTLIRNLNSAVDAVWRETDRGIQLFVLEQRAASGQRLTGRVLLIDVDSPNGRELVTGLNDPIGLAVDETNHRLLVSSRGDFLIFFVPLP